MLYRSTAALLIAAAFAIGGVPAQAQRVAPTPDAVTVDDARDIAAERGVRAFDKIEFNAYNGRWEIDGRDAMGRDVELDIDANTGAIMSEDRE